MTVDEIKLQFSTHKIGMAQLDPNGICNAKCWFCPVKYEGNPADGKSTMSPELLTKIIENIVEERQKPDGLVSKSFNGFYTAHYNEVLLYRHLDVMLELCRRHHLVTAILSNGTTLTPDRTDLLKRYPDVVSGICLNIPAFERELWSKRSGMKPEWFERLVENVRYACQQFPDMVRGRSFSIQVNCVTRNSFMEVGGWLQKTDLPDIDLDPENGELKQQSRLARELFPGAHVFEVPSLVDRAGLLKPVMTMKPYLDKHYGEKKVIGCGNGREWGGRPVGYLHVNAVGDAFLCCNDFHFDFKFGSFKTQRLADFWGKETHVNQILQAYETICKNCCSAVFEL